MSEFACIAGESIGVRVGAELDGAGILMNFDFLVRWVKNSVEGRDTRTRYRGNVPAEKHAHGEGIRRQALPLVRRSIIVLPRRSIKSTNRVRLPARNNHAPAQMIERA